MLRSALLLLARLLPAIALRFHVAPMQCYTNRHLRYLLRRLNEDIILWTEMEKAAEALFRRREALSTFDSHDSRST